MFGLGKKKVAVHAPFAGTAVAVTEIPDPVFAEGMLGEGFAVIPGEDQSVVEVCAPVAGTLTKVFKTGHAFVVKSTAGLDVLVHIGLETVELKGAGMTILANSGAEVQAGTPVVRVDLGVVREAGLNPITPVVFSTKKQVGSVASEVGSVNTDSVVATVTLA